MIFRRPCPESVGKKARMAKDKRPWRKLVKKLRRSKIRIAIALKGLASGPGQSTTAEVNRKKGTIPNPNRDLETVQLAKTLTSDNESHLQSSDNEVMHTLLEAAWLEREHQAQLEFQMKCAELEKREIIRIAEEKRIRIEWEEKQRIEKEKRDEEERIEVERRKKQEEEFDQFLGFLSGDIENPPLPYLMPDKLAEQSQQCLYFSRTGACRFGDRCTRGHPKPTLSNTILVPNWFSHFSIDHGLRNFDTEITLEYEDSEMYDDFLEFYEDVLPEFRKCGKVSQFKVCRNFEPHLSGNVYIQYATIWDAVQAYRKFNGRFFNGKQLSLQFVKIESWNGAICGQFNRGRCAKGRSCNYLHVFRNPTREFVQADRDFVDILNKQDQNEKYHLSDKETRRSRHNRQSRSRSSSSSKSKCHSNSKRSRSPSSSKPHQPRHSRHEKSSKSRSHHSRASSSSTESTKSKRYHHSRSKNRSTSFEATPFKDRAMRAKANMKIIPLELDKLPSKSKSVCGPGSGVNIYPLECDPTCLEVNDPATEHIIDGKVRHSKHKRRKAKKNSKHKKKKKKASKKSKRRKMYEEADETMSDASIAVNTPSPRR